MRELASNEKILLNELLQLETNALIQIKAAEAIVMNRDLKMNLDAAIIATEARIKSLQQFIQENHIIPAKEMH